MAGMIVLVGMMALVLAGDGVFRGDEAD